MNKYRSTKLERVTKAKAKQLYNNGFSVLFISCNLDPENNFYSSDREAAAAAMAYRLLIDKE